MPTYQYVCTGECGQLLEAVQSFSDAPLEECPTCGGRLRKKFSAVGVVFKGSGFYRTDSRSGSSSGGSPTSAPKEGASASGDGAGGAATSGAAATPKSDSGSSGSSGTASGSSGTASATTSSTPAKSA